MATAGSDSQASTLGFAFRLAQGAGRLTLEDRRFFGWLDVERLELEVPDLEPPIDLAAGSELFQNRRTKVSHAALRIGQRELDTLVSELAPKLVAVGADRVVLRPTGDHLTASARFREGQHLADLVAIIRIVPRGGLVALVVERALVFGFLPTPAPVLAHRLLVALTGAAHEPEFPGAPVVRGLGLVELDSLAALLWHMFPPRGWRLPDPRSVSLIAARPTRGALVARFARGGDGAQPDAGGSDLLASMSRHREAERLLMSGDTGGSMRAYRTALAGTGGDQDFVFARLLAIAASAPEHFAFAVDLARDALSRWPDFPAAHAAVASVRWAQRDEAAAAERYRVLAKAGGSTDDEIAVRSALVGARLFDRQDRNKATELYERVIELRPGQPEATDALMTRYRESGRVHDLIRLLRARIASSAVPATQLADHLTLAELYLDSLDDPTSARDVIDRALELAPELGAPETLLARAEIAVGETATAAKSLERAAEKCRAAGDVRGQTDALMHAAALWSDLGRPDRALTTYEQVLVARPEAAEALAGAARTKALGGDHAGAAELWQRLCDTSTDVPTKVAEYSVELGIARMAQGDLAAARNAFAWASHRGSAEIQVRAHRLLSEAASVGEDGETAADEINAAITLAESKLGDSGSDDGQAWRQTAAKLFQQRAMLALAEKQHTQVRSDLERAFELAPLGSDVRDAAARALLDVAREEEDLAAQRRWLDVLASVDMPPIQKAKLLVERARLSESPSDEERTQILGSLDLALQATDEPAIRAEALELKAILLEGADDPIGRAHTLTQRIDLATAPFERAVATTQAARAWLEADRSDEALRLAQRAAEELSSAGGVEYSETWLTLGDAAWRNRAWSLVIQAADRIRGGEFDVPDTVVASSVHRAGIAFDETGNLDDAARYFEMVTAMDEAPQELRANTWRLLASVYERLDRHEDAASALESYASDENSAAPESTRADAWYRAGELYRRLPDRNDDSERCLEEALKLVADHLPALDALERLKRDGADYERVAVILGRKIAATSRHPNRQKALLARLADLQHLRLGRTDVARESYMRALEIDPTFRPALRFVVQDSRDRGDAEAAADALSKLSLELESDLDLPDEAAALNEERIAAALQLSQLATEDDSDETADKALVALEANLVPDHYDDRILEGIERILRVKKDWRAVADVLGQRAASASSSESLSWDLERIDLLSGTVNDKGAALAAARAALSRNPDNGTLKEFVATLEGDTVRTESEAAPGADHISPSDLRAQADQACFDGDFDRAAELLEELAGYQPLGSDEPGSRHFGNRAARGELFLQLADIYYDHLEDTRRARESMRRAAEAFGTGSRRDSTLRLLASEASSVGAAEDTTRALEAIEAHRLTGNDRLQLARAYVATERDSAAVEVLEQARVRGSLTDDGAKMLTHLYRERERKSELAESLERGARSSPPDIAETRLREALNLFENALASAEGAERVRRQIVELGGKDAEDRPPNAEELERAADAALTDGDSAVAADLLSREVHERARKLSMTDNGLDSHLLAALDRLRRVTYTIAPSPDLGGTGHFEALVRGLLSAANVADTDTSIALLREAGAVKRNQLRDPRGAADALARAFSHRPQNSALFSELAEALRDAGDYTQLTAAYELHLEYLEGPRRAKALTELARVIRSVQGDSERVRKLLTEANSVAKDDQEEDTSGLVGALLLEGEALELDGRREEAISRYYAAFAKEPDDNRALEALDRLYGELGDPESQANVLGQLIEHTEPGSLRASLWFRRAQLYRDALRREHDAYRCLKEAYANDPDSSDIANSLRSAVMARGEWPLAAELLYREIAGAPDDRERAALQLELAMIYDQKLIDPQQAIRNYERALQLDPSIPAIPGPLARLYDHAGRHTEAVAMYEQAAKLEFDQEAKADTLRRAAECAELAGQSDEAERIRRLVNPTPSELGVIEDSVEDPDTAPMERLERKLRATSDRDERLGIHRELLEEAKKAEDSKAIRSHARAILDADSRDAAAYRTLKALAEEDEDDETLASLLAARARAVGDTDERIHLLIALGNLERDRLADVNAAVRSFESALEADPENPEALDALAQIAYLRSDWERARALYARLRGERSALAPELIAYRRGEIAEMLGLDEEAAVAFATAAELAPGNRNALAALIRASVRIRDFASAIEAGRSRLALVGTEDVAAMTAARLQLAQLCDAANDIVTAIYYYELVVAEEPNSRAALEALVTLYAAHGDHQGAIRSLRSLIAVAADLEERAERHYLLGEIFRANVGDHEAAADEYIKAVDLDPNHAPTLRRLLDYYWSLDDSEALLDIARDLHEREALIVIETPSPTLTRVMLVAALARDPLAKRIGDSLPGNVNHSTASVMLEALRIGRSATAEQLAQAGLWLAEQLSAVELAALLGYADGDAPENASLEAALESLQ